MCPDFPGDAVVKDDFCKKLCEYIKVRLEAEKALRSSMHSQSTTISRSNDRSMGTALRELTYPAIGRDDVYLSSSLV